MWSIFFAHPFVKKQSPSPSRYWSRLPDHFSGTLYQSGMCCGCWCSSYFSFSPSPKSYESEILHLWLQIMGIDLYNLPSVILLWKKCILKLINIITNSHYSISCVIGLISSFLWSCLDDTALEIFYTNKIDLILSSYIFQTRATLSGEKSDNMHKLSPDSRSQMDEVFSLAILITIHAEGGSQLTELLSLPNMLPSASGAGSQCSEATAIFLEWFMCESVSSIRILVILFFPEPGSYQTRSVSSYKMHPSWKVYEW